MQHQPYNLQAMLMGEKLKKEQRKPTNAIPNQNTNVCFVA